MQRPMCRHGWTRPVTRRHGNESIRKRGSLHFSEIPIGLAGCKAVRCEGRAIHGAPQCKGADVERRGHTLAGLSRCDHRPCFRHIDGRQFAGPAQPNPAQLRGLQSRFRPVADQFALELGQCGKIMDVEPSARACRIDLLAQGRKPDATILQRCDRPDQVRQRSSQSIQPPDDQMIARPCKGKRRSQTVPVPFVA